MFATTGRLRLLSFIQCFTSAKLIIEQMIEVLTPSGLMRAALDGHLVFASFTSAFTLKLLHPEFAQLLTRQMEDEIFELIDRLITTLQDGTIDERHTPRLMAHIETLTPQSPNVVTACTSTSAHRMEAFIAVHTRMHKICHPEPALFIGFAIASLSVEIQSCTIIRQQKSLSRMPRANA
ncbi:hypothetical protein EDD22DRAFT_986586 [Suillus occidentalis]|nr:hypothetical protein EDD22DRAFT_986586 [Suillus occidentalis]